MSLTISFTSNFQQRPAILSPTYLQNLLHKLRRHIPRLTTQFNDELRDFFFFTSHISIKKFDLICDSYIIRMAKTDDDNDIDTHFSVIK